MGRTVALLTLTALVAGCGTDTKPDFIARADAICASAVREVRSIAAPSFTHSARQRLSALGVYVTDVLPLVRSEATQLRALPRPQQGARERAALTRYLGALAQVVGVYGEFSAAAKTGDAQGVASAEAALRASPVAALANRYGLRSCGTPGATVA